MRPFTVHRIWNVYSPNVRAQLPDKSRWVAAVGEPYEGNLLERLRAAWWVFTGRAYALEWPKPGDLEQHSIRPPYGAGGEG